MVRKFILANSNGVAIDFLTDMNILGVNPTGLGVSLDNDLIRAGSSFILEDSNVSESKIELTMVLGAKSGDPYSDYDRLLRLLAFPPYVLKYETKKNNYWYRNVVLSEITKGEINTLGVLTEKMIVDCVSPWYRWVEFGDRMPKDNLPEFPDPDNPIDPWQPQDPDKPTPNLGYGSKAYIRPYYSDMLQRAYAYDYQYEEQGEDEEFLPEEFNTPMPLNSYMTRALNFISFTNFSYYFDSRSMSPIEVMIYNPNNVPVSINMNWEYTPSNYIYAKQTDGIKGEIGGLEQIVISSIPNQQGVYRRRNTNITKPSWTTLEPDNNLINFSYGNFIKLAPEYVKDRATLKLNSVPNNCLVSFRLREERMVV